MKVLKFLLLLIVVVSALFTIWFYYPQYQIHMLKKQTVGSNTSVNQPNYIKYISSLDKKVINHVAIGDSVIRGVGAVNENENLVSIFSHKLGEDVQKQVEFHNDGISGITSTRLNEVMQTGQFDEQIKNADVITVNVGGNDILKITNKKETDYYKAFKSFNELTDNYKQNLSDITSHIHRLNPNATVLILELYNPLHVDNEFYSVANKMLPKWNLISYQISSKYDNMIVVETTKVINENHLDYLSADGVHPNSTGYNAIADQIINQLKTEKKNS